MEELTGLDARFLYSETPTAHMHTIKVAIVDVSSRSEPLGPETFGSLFAERLDRMPGLRRRVIEVPHQLGHPVWIDDPDFDLANHIRWQSAPDPGGRRELAETVARIAAVQLARDLPLWELTVVDQLEGGQIACVVKIHHALADGVAAAAMLENAFMAMGSADAVTMAYQPEPIPAPLDLQRQARRSRLRRLARAPGTVRRSLHGMVAAARMQRSTGMKAPKLFSAPRSVVNVSLPVARTYAVADLPVDELRAIAKAHGASFNDVFLTLCGGALRRHIASRGDRGDKPMVAGVPIATHLDERRLWGNHVDNMVIPVHNEIADPLDRLAAVHHGSVAARTTREALGTDLFESRAGHTPRHLYPLSVRLWAATRLADHIRPPISLIASNVAGPSEPLETEGGVVTELWSVGPVLEGIGLNVTAWSYAGRLYVSVLGCPRSLPDPWALTSDLEQAFDELRARALHPAPEATMRPSGSI